MQLAVYECVGVSKATKQIGAFSIKRVITTGSFTDGKIP